MSATGLLTISADDYHADRITADRPTLSSSIAQTLITKSALHAWADHPKLNPDFERKTEQKFDLGTAVHSILLQGVDNVHVCQYENWRTNAAKEARDEARAHGRIPLLAHEYKNAKAMLDATAKQLERLTVDPIPFTDGLPEATLIWEDNGVKCRARYDWLHNDNRTISDYKSTSATANPDKWVRTAFTIGADIQTAFYLRGFRAHFGLDAEMRYVVQETYPPYALSVVSLGPDVLALADAKVEYALKTWRECLATDHWPGYPTRVAYAELPAWEEARWLEREAREAA